ncbi:gamma-glutamyl-gamma-aminobutyrate hydrolase [Sporosarcina sp. P12(2017)]|uniref:gamma-glutamyl-gamma-aminobutyrate hydrolase family protein n=1 Tax=unclassified Sporosarcina TaxID=2647733 RepID=UPI000C163EDC|nr:MULTISPECIES: gamma-glutamyl-gamma-aminobutyrate hydrolase family protein [unclassified Sporosarcina]PIC56276.1 gamma-glutamyl-gamma-aminobutyrate hydrolase [Sporosarcina sp. P10]PIC59520.1 gamma-glutamyl-gamma-aminobutyrate hydrolase [Sporosarcina sp. P12(2017)]
MKPLIGVTSDIDQNGDTLVQTRYIRAVRQAGGVPVILPVGLEAIEEVCDRLDGVLLIGGEDVDPYLYGEEPHRQLGKVLPERDESELALIKTMADQDKPVFGICRGYQLINVAFGGTIYQDMYAQLSEDLLQHHQLTDLDFAFHSIDIVGDSKLAEWAGTSEVRVNSLHHQAVKEVHAPLVVTAVAKDGVVEAIESTAHRFVVGVQWHPEAMVKRDDRLSLKLFEQFIEAASEKR